MQHGPYGSSEGEKWCLMLDHGGRISEVIIKSGSVIDSIAFTTIKPTDCGCGYSATHTKFGGNGGKPNLVCFNSYHYATYFSYKMVFKYFRFFSFFTFRNVYWGWDHRIDIVSHFLDRFNIRFCVNIGFYILINPFYVGTINQVRLKGWVKIELLSIF